MMNITKRNGRIEPLDLNKIHKVLEWAAKGLKGVSVSQIEISSRIQLKDGMSTSDIHETLIKTAADLISEHSPDYQYLAARLAIFHLRKKAYKKFEPPAFKEHIKNMVKNGFYDPKLLDSYTDEELDFFDSYIDHSKDMDLSYAGVKQYEGKYLVQNRVTEEIYETPQMALMAISIAAFQFEEPTLRKNLVRDAYHELSEQTLSMPTPIMAGLRTPSYQYSSCVKVDAGDSLDSINAAASTIVKYISQKAGIGINVGRIRAVGSPIRKGEVFHTGLIPFIKHFQTAVKSCSQGGVRGGAATAFFPIWHYEFESLVVLKNNRGVEENRSRHLDYGVQINGFLYQRLLSGGNITLFSPSDVPGLYEAFANNQDEFARLYEQYEQDPSIRKKTLKAIEVFQMLAQERAQTGRIYIQNIDHSNTHSSFLEQEAPVYMSNLCMEITLPTKPLTNINDPNGEIALCTLAAFNLGKINYNDIASMRRLSNVVVRFLDNILTYQSYPILAAELSTKARRPLGVGVINYAYFLAKNGVKYSDGSANRITHELFESIQYHLIEASVNLAKERGACEAFNQTKYSKGILPIDTYKKHVDELVNPVYKLDWEKLRENVVSYGMRNSTLTALMPSETSSQISNATNGIEPPRGLISIKASKDGILKQVVPDIETLSDSYELLWTIPDNKGYINLVGVMQKFIDQSISANTNYDPSKFKSGKVPVSEILKDILTAYKNGVKTLYYHNTRDGASDDSAKESGCDSGSCVI